MKKINSGIFVAFLGRDGVGKTSLIDASSQLIEPYFSKTTSYYLTTNTLLSARRDKDPTQPHGKRIRGSLLSFIKLVAFCLEYIAGYYLKVCPALRKNQAVLFDRYYYDLLADNKRYRHGLNEFWSKFFMRIIPKPHIIFIIDVPTAEVILRKNEFSVKEHELLRRKYLDLEKILPNTCVIQNDGEKETAARQIANKIVEGIKKKIRQTQAIVLFFWMVGNEGGILEVAQLAA